MIKKQTVKIISGVLLALLLSGCSVKLSHEIERLDARLKDHNNGVMVVAHRACWKKAPENSILAIRDCIDLGIDVVELDVRKTKDNVLVLMHDKTLDRTTSGTGLLADYTYQQLRELTLKERDGGDGAALTEFRVPLFKEALAVAKGNVLINVDAKEEVMQAAFAEVMEYNAQQQVILKKEVAAADPIFTEFDFLREAHFISKITEGDRRLSEHVKSFHQHQPIAYELKTNSAEYLLEGVDEIKQQGARLWINTLSVSPHKCIGHTDEFAVNDPDAHWGVLIRMGANMLQTDEPELLMNYLQSNNLR